MENHNSNLSGACFDGNHATCAFRGCKCACHKEARKTAEVPGYTEFNRGFDAGMAVGIKQTNDAWIAMTPEKREQIAEAWQRPADMERGSKDEQPKVMSDLQYHDLFNPPSKPARKSAFICEPCEEGHHYACWKGILKKDCDCKYSKLPEPTLQEKINFIGKRIGLVGAPEPTPAWEKDLPRHAEGCMCLLCTWKPTIERSIKAIEAKARAEEDLTLRNWAVGRGKEWAASHPYQFFEQLIARLANEPKEA
jgi:hypothetical protein